MSTPLSLECAPGSTEPQPAAAAEPDSLRARAAELFFVGGATFVLLPLLWLFQRSVGRDAAEEAVDAIGFHAAFFVNNPHFAVTYLLFYRGARERLFGKVFPPALRARYAVAGVVVPIALFLWAARALATGSAHTMGLMIQLMFLLVGWHYVKQGFGVLTVLSARRGIRFGALERAVILGHCYAAWAYAWASPADPGRKVQEKGVVYTSIAHPPWLETATGIVFGASALALVAVLARKWRAERRLPFSPLLVFLVTVWFWTVYSSIDRLMMYFIPALHSLQYLYMVWLLRRNEALSEEGPPAFGKPASVRVLALAVSAVGLAWILFRGAPDFLDRSPVVARPPGGAAGLGETPYLAAIYVLVNIHHYFMDHVIWRRDNPETRHLRARPRPVPASGAPESA